MAQITPSRPNRPKARLQETNWNKNTTSKGVNAPPQRALSQIMPCARTRSSCGSQVAKARVMLGKHPASPAPNKSCVKKSERKLKAQPVATVKKDHHTTMRI